VEPLFDIVEGLIVRHIVDNDDTMGSSVVGRSDGTETLLSSGIPDLKLDCLSVKLDSADFKINANGRNVRFRVGIIGKPEKQTGFTDTGVSNEEELEEIVAVVVEWKKGGCSESDERGQKAVLGVVNRLSLRSFRGYHSEHGIELNTIHNTSCIGSALRRASIVIWSCAEEGVVPKQPRCGEDLAMRIWNLHTVVPASKLIHVPPLINDISKG